MTKPSLTPHVDNFDAAYAEMEVIVGEKTSRKDAVGISARLSLVGQKELCRRVAEELDAGTDLQEICAGVVSTINNLLFSMIELAGVDVSTERGIDAVIDRLRTQAILSHRRREVGVNAVFMKGAGTPPGHG